MVACGRPGGGASRRRTVLSFLSIRGGRFGFRPEHVSRVDEAVEGRGVDETEGERRLAQRRALVVRLLRDLRRSEEHTSELQSLMRISYAVFCLKKKKQMTLTPQTNIYQHKYVTKK